MLNTNSSPGGSSSELKGQNREEMAPILTAPGAGLPWYHRLALRYYVGPFVAGKSDWNVSEQTFHKVNGRILQEIEKLSEKQLSKKIFSTATTGFGRQLEVLVRCDGARTFSHR